MKKLISIIMITVFLMTGSAYAVTESLPTLSNACTFDRNALTGDNNGDLIIHINYAADEEYMEIFFGMKVDFSSDLSAEITDPTGNVHTAEILNQDWTSLKIWVDGLDTLKVHTLTITGVTAADTAAYPEYTEPGPHIASFITIPSCCV